MSETIFTGDDCICIPSCAEADCESCPYCCQEYAASHPATTACATCHRPTHHTKLVDGLCADCRADEVSQ